MTEPETADQALPEAPRPQPAAAPARPARRFRPTRTHILALVAAFVLGACLCGGLGVGVLAVAFHHERVHPRQGNQRDGRGGRPRQVTPPRIMPVPTPTTAPTTAATPSTSPS